MARAGVAGEQRWTGRDLVLKLCVACRHSLGVLEPEHFGVDREPFAQPDVLPALDADRIAEPLVGQFMDDGKFEATQQVGRNWDISAFAQCPEDRACLRFECQSC